MFVLGLRRWTQSSRLSGLVVCSVVHSYALTSFCVIFCMTEHFDQTKALELPKEHEMLPKDKYTVFSPHARGYRKGVHKVPKWTRVSFHFSML